MINKLINAIKNKLVENTKDNSRSLKTIHYENYVNPLSEAEIYLAYGRDEQAKKLLKAALDEGKITSDDYNNCLIKKNYEELIKPKKIAHLYSSKLKPTEDIYVYYINITTGYNEKIKRMRMFIHLKNKNNSIEGLEEIEEILNKYTNNLSTYQSSWSIDYLIEVK